jgi:hypothetical protein
MRIVEGRVVKGAIVTKARFPEGARVTVIQHDDRPPVKVSREIEAEILAGIRELDAGKGLPIERLRARLRRQRPKKK